MAPLRFSENRSCGGGMDAPATFTHSIYFLPAVVKKVLMTASS